MTQNKIPGSDPGICESAAWGGGKLRSDRLRPNVKLQFGRFVIAPISWNSLTRTTWRVASRLRALITPSRALRKSVLLVFMVVSFRLVWPALADNR